MKALFVLVAEGMCAAPGDRGAVQNAFASLQLTSFVAVAPLPRPAGDGGGCR